MITASEYGPMADGTQIRVLIAEDEAHLGTILEQFLRARGFAVALVRNGRAALERLQAEAFDVALLDVVMPELDGLEVLRQIRAQPAPPQLVMATGNSSIETAMTALRMGAFDVVAKPYRMAQIELLLRRAWERGQLLAENARLRGRLRAGVEASRFETRSRTLQSLLQLLDTLENPTSSVVISGERGVGKRQLARELYARAAAASASPDRPWLEFPTGQVSPADQRGALFGTPEGTLGYLELADGGVLYLPHAERITAEVWTALSAVTGGGGDDGWPADLMARRRPPQLRLILSFTDRPMTGGGTGGPSEPPRPSLPWLHLQLPPLRERQEDIPLLTRVFLQRAADRLGVSVVPAVDPAVDAQLGAYEWPGNVRELDLVMEGALRRALVRDAGSTIQTRDLEGLPEGLPGIKAGNGAASALDGGLRGEFEEGPIPPLATTERIQIIRALEATGWHQGRAATQLGISAKTLYRKIREFQLTRPNPRGGIPIRSRDR